MSRDSERTPERIATGSIRPWVLLGADRRLLVVVSVVGLYLVIVGIATAWPTPIRSLVAEYDPIAPLFQALVTGVITIVTFVVTINQLVLSQELGAIGDQRERMEESMLFRRDASEYVEPDVSPSTPAAFMRALVESSRESAARLSALAADEQDEELRQRIDTYTDTLVENAEEVSASLKNAQFGTFEVVGAALDYDYSYKIYQGRTLREEGDGRLAETTLETLDELIEVLQLFGPAREHFKTLYFQWELTNLSREMIYTGLPALVVAVGGVLLLGDPGQFPGVTFGVENFTWIVAAAVVATVVPFLLLLSYMLRISVIAKRTLAMGPFILREADRIDDDLD